MRMEAQGEYRIDVYLDRWTWRAEDGVGFARATATIG